MGFMAWGHAWARVRCRACDLQHACKPASLLFCSCTAECLHPLIPYRSIGDGEVSSFCCSNIPAVRMHCRSEVTSGVHGARLLVCPACQLWASSVVVATPTLTRFTEWRRWLCRMRLQPSLPWIIQDTHEQQFQAGGRVAAAPSNSN